MSDRNIGPLQGFSLYWKTKSEFSSDFTGNNKDLEVQMLHIVVTNSCFDLNTGGLLVKHHKVKLNPIQRTVHGSKRITNKLSDTNFTKN